EKNVNMPEYMLTTKAEGPPPAFVEPSTFSDLAPHFHIPDEDEADHEASSHVADPEEVIRRHRVNATRQKRSAEQVEPKRASSLMASLCAVLFVVSFVMGVGLVRSQDRIDRMEDEIQQLVNAHHNLFVHMSSLESAPAFAETNQQTVETAAQAATAENSDHFYTHVYEAPPANDTAVLPEPQEPPQAPIVQAEPAPQAQSPPVAPAPMVSTVPATYTIQPGDSLLAISLYFFGDIAMVDEILALNGLADPDLIVAGSTIVLPQP
ncbi:MAG: LysM peptidoglycan-binding domain-containing protein, partial [Defluviitaleaceae bacterium]|nr:LysM peptidoglycan-binding domain-containing protein [Defluviitaleaceae bacterium]